jgi:hypothetical protein
LNITIFFFLNDGKKDKMLASSPDCSENPPDFSSGDCNEKRDNANKNA